LKHPYPYFRLSSYLFNSPPVPATLSFQEGLTVYIGSLLSLLLERSKDMYLAYVRVELGEALRPEEQDSFERIELTVENAVAVSLQIHFDHVKVINVSVSPSCEYMGDDVSQSRRPT
jgi:hypothetical protein